MRFNVMDSAMKAAPVEDKLVFHLLQGNLGVKPAPSAQDSSVQAKGLEKQSWDISLQHTPAELWRWQALRTNDIDC